MAANPQQNSWSIPSLALYGVFLLSGIAAIVYQLVWQRALFVLYGTDTASVTVVVAAFMLGLGLGSLAGGELSRREVPLLLLFALAEFGIGLFGLGSLTIFELVGQATTGASLFATGVISFFIVLIPTSLMGATLPLLVAFIVERTRNVGVSVGVLYFVNTLGSALGCFIAASWLFARFAMSESVLLAAGVNLVVAAFVAGAWWLGRKQ